ncbi:MAG: TolC family protein [Candidatus Obscuribacterales bacterium]|nr:TolC family protein [Candidatus Obscuribacterales bacterium]
MLKAKSTGSGFFLATTLGVTLFSNPVLAQIERPEEIPFDWTENALQAAPSDRPNHPVDRFPISLAKAFEVSHTQNPNVVAALKNLDQAKAQIKIAGARPNPQLALQYGFGTPYTEIISGNTQQLGGNQLFETGGKRQARLKYARANYVLTEYQLADLRYDVRSAVRKAYAELAAAEANIDLVENQRKLVQRLNNIATKRFQSGKTMELDTLQIRLALEGFEALRTSALSRLRQASIQLDYLLGFASDRDLDVTNNGLFKLSLERTELVPSPDDPLQKLDQLIKLAFEQRPDLKAAQQQTITSKSAITLAKAQAVPDILIGSGWVFSTYKKATGARQQEGAYLNVNMDLPIFYHKQGEIAAAKAANRQAQMQLSATQLRVEVDVRAAYAALVSARSNLSLYRKTLIPLALNVVKNAHDSYEKGSNDVGGTLVAQQQFQQTFSNYFDTVVAYQNAWADLETAIGKKIEF